MTEPFRALSALGATESLADRAYDHLIAAILHHDLPPGTPLSIPELARRLDVSRSPVREAVQRLIHEGLAEHVLHRGAVVAKVDEQSFLDLLDVRERLESLAARLAAERITAAEVADLGQILDEHENCLCDDDPGLSAEYDVRFHALIRQAARNSDLDAMLARTQTRAHLSLHTFWQGGRDPGRMFAEHRNMFYAIAARDPAAAERAAEQHIAGLRDRLQRSIAKRNMTVVGE